MYMQMKAQHFSSQIWDLAFQTCRNLKRIVFYSFRTIYIIVLPLMEVTEIVQLSITSNWGFMIKLRMCAL